LTVTAGVQNTLQHFQGQVTLAHAGPD